MRYFVLSAIVLNGLLAVSGTNFLPPPLNPYEIDRTVIARPDLATDYLSPKLPIAPSSVGYSTSNCDTAGLIDASGDELIKMLRSVDKLCTYELFSLTGEDARKAFNEEDMVTVAKEYYSISFYYDQFKPTENSLLQFTLYLRAGFYVHFNHPDSTGPYERHPLYSYVEHGLRFFFEKPKLESTNDVHLETFKENLILVTNADLNLALVEVVAEQLRLITKAKATWKLLDYGEAGVVNSLFEIYFRLTYEEGANEFLADKFHIPLALDDFMNGRANLLGSTSEFLLSNAAGELARMLQFSSIKERLSPVVRNQINQYSLTHGAAVWISMAAKIEYFDYDNCDYYGVCDYKEVAKATILPINHVCAVTKVDRFTIIAQQITPAQLEEVCSRLKAHEAYFHTRLATNWKPVADDNTNNLNVVIYASSNDYTSFNFALFGFDTNNGGIYIEGDPSKPGNLGQFFCYVQHDYDGNWDVWNLEHEITHYFDGRYDMYGDFQFMYNFPTVWWSEGLGEYMANKDDYSSVDTTCVDKKYPLSALFETTYNHDVERIYRYSYNAVRFFFERHSSEVDKLLGFFRIGKLNEYTDYIRHGIGKKYDGEFSKWCDCLVKGDC